MAITILGHPISTCTKRVLVVLEEKNVTDYTVETIDVLAGAHKKPEFLAKQPFGQIPVLEDGDISIYESRAMARYVCDKYDGEGTALFGKTPKEKAAVNQWLEVEGQTFNGPISAIVVELVFKKHHGKEADEAKVAEAAEQAAKVLDVYEAHLTKNEYVAGDFLSLADLSHLPYTDLLMHTVHANLITSRPNVNKWWEKISALPSWKKVNVPFPSKV
eukprot:TRINITY_DN9183_c0_g1_i1.p1 TRINITY_DN9183_c0_g1~~TRINITY_DN9183_c0_g1_i1.p1  ORF type:complete len:217 (+),score=54.99 TRINITY_DN9183_c0_g1_i1:222-872(+)